MEEGDGKIREHEVDKAAEVKLLKQIVKKKGWRVNKYDIRHLHDATAFRVEVEHFIKGTSMGTKIFRAFLSDETFKEIEALYDAIPRKQYIDTRIQMTRERPVKNIEEKQKKELDLNKFFSD